MARVRIEAEVLDAKQAAGKLREIDRALERLNKAHASGRITTDQLRRSTAVLERKQLDLGKSTRSATQAITKMRVAAAAAAIVVVRALRNMSSEALEFEKAFANVSTLIDTRTPQGVKQLATLQKQIFALNPALGSATELTQGLYQALSAGVEPAKAVRLVGEAALFAKAGLTSTLTAVDIMTTIMNAYGDAAGKANEISSVLFATVQEGKTTAEQLAVSLGLVIPNAVALKIPLTEVNAAIATLTKGGFKTSIAVTSMSQAMLAFIKPTEGAVKILKQAGLSFADLREIIGEQGLAAGLKVLAEVTGGNVEEMTKFFDSAEAFKAVLALTGEQAEEFARITGVLEAAQADGNVTARAAEKVFKTVGARAETMGNAVKTFLIENLVKLEPLFIGIIDAAEEFGPVLKFSFHIAIVAITEVNRFINSFISGINTIFASIFFGIKTMLKWVNTLDFVKKHLGFVGEALHLATGAEIAFDDAARRATDRIIALDDSLNAIDIPLAGLPPALKKAGDATDDMGRATSALTDKEIAAAEAIEATINELILQATWLGRTADEVTLLKLELAGASKEQLELARHTLEWIRVNKEAMDAAKKAGEALKANALKAAEANRKAFEKMTGDIEKFLDRVFLTARSFSDVWRQLMGQIVSSFAKSVSRMVAEWFTGMRQMQTGAALGGQGIIGGLLGPLFGTGGGGGGATALATSGALATASAGIASSSGIISTPSFNPALGNPALGGSISGTVTGIPNAQGGATQGAGGAVAFGGIGGLLKNPAFLRLAIGGGAALGGLGLLLAGGPVKGAIGGLLGTFGALVLANVLLTGVAAAATLGLSVAGGILIGSFLRGRSKRKATRIEEDFVRQGLNVVDQFKKFQIAFEPTISSLEQIKLQGEQALLTAGLGRAGRRGAQNLARNMDIQIQAVTSLQRQREARLVDIQNLTLPEFALGGSVRGINSPRGGLLALLHPGEFVMRREAVQSVGESFLAGLNRLPQFQSGGPVGGGQSGSGKTVIIKPSFHFSAIDGPSFANWWARSRRQVVSVVKKAILDGALR